MVLSAPILPLGQIFIHQDISDWCHLNLDSQLSPGDYYFPF